MNSGIGKLESMGIRFNPNMSRDIHEMEISDLSQRMSMYKNRYGLDGIERFYPEYAKLHGEEEAKKVFRELRSHKNRVRRAFYFGSEGIKSLLTCVKRLYQRNKGKLLIWVGAFLSVFCVFVFWEVVEFLVASILNSWFGV